MRGLACRGEAKAIPPLDRRHPQPGAAAPTQAAGLPLSAPLHSSSQSVPPASPLLTCSALSREGRGSRGAHRSLARRAARFPLLGSGSARAAPQPRLVLNSTPPGASRPRRAEGEEPGTQAPRESPREKIFWEAERNPQMWVQRNEKEGRKALQTGGRKSVMQIESLKLEECSITPLPNHPGPLEVANEQAQG